MLEPRGGYSGTAQLIVEEYRTFDIEVVLTGYVEVIEIRTFGGTRRVDGVTSWAGTVFGLSESDQLRILGKPMKLLLPDGSEGKVALRNAQGRLVGAGPAPFPIPIADA